MSRILKVFLILIVLFQYVCNLQGNLRQKKIETKDRGYESQHPVFRIFDDDFYARIVGGKNIEIKNLPYQVSIQKKGKHFCGGSLITPQHVVTAAHCMLINNLESLTIRAGSTSHDHGGVVRDVAAIYVHPWYNDYTIRGDIAILKLTDPLPLNENIQPINIAKKYACWAPGTVGYVSGWGVTQEGLNKRSDSLRVAALKMVDREYCQIEYQYALIDENMLCLYGGEMDSCKGDSGGPFVVDGTLVGIVSYGNGCARNGIPGVYTNVAAMYDFIKFVVENS